MSSAGEEMKNPKRDVPRVILWSGALIADPLFVRHRRNPLRGSDREALDRHGNVGCAGRARQGVGAGGRHRRLPARNRIPVRVRRERRDVEPRREPRGGRRGRRRDAPRGSRPAAPAVQDAASRIRLDGDRVHRPSRRRRAPVQQPVQHLLDDVPGDRASASCSATCWSSRPSSSCATAGPTSRGPIGFREAESRPGSPPGCARSTSSEPACSSSCRRRRARNRSRKPSFSALLTLVTLVVGLPAHPAGRAAALDRSV